MRFLSLAACILALTAPFACAQEQPQTAGVASQTPTTTVYTVSADVTAPVLLPPGLIQVSNEKCKKKNISKDEIILSLFVDSDGKPHRVTFLQATGNELDQKALDIVNADQFRPGSRNGEPVAVWQTLTLAIESCVDNPKDPNTAYHLIAQPEQLTGNSSDHPRASPVIASHDSDRGAQPMRIGGSVSPPAPIFTPQAIYSEQARKKKITGYCVISLIVDAHGMPRNPRMVRPLGYGLDENALAAVRHYRFKPAMKAGEPVAVMISIEVNFRLY